MDPTCHSNPGGLTESVEYRGAMESAEYRGAMESAEYRGAMESAEHRGALSAWGKRESFGQPRGILPPESPGPAGAGQAAGEEPT